MLARVCRTPPLRFAPQPTPNTPALAEPATPKIYPRTVGGPAMQAPTSKRQGLRKKISLFQNFAVGAGPRSARPCRACKPENPPPAPLAGLRCRPLQAKGKACVKKISLFQNFIVGASIARPPLPGLQPRKYTPRTVGGPAMQAPTRQRQGLRKKISLFQNFIVGASIARPLKPCAAARPLGWSRAPPLPCTARECV